jgi:hypothetical protein
MADWCGGMGVELCAGNRGARDTYIHAHSIHTHTHIHTNAHKIGHVCMRDSRVVTRVSKITKTPAKARPGIMIAIPSQPRAPLREREREREREGEREREREDGA